MSRHGPLSSQNMGFNLGAFGEFIDFTRKTAGQVSSAFGGDEPVEFNQPVRRGVTPPPSRQPSALDIDLKQIERVHSDYVLNNRGVGAGAAFLEKNQATPEEWADFAAKSPVDAELMLVEDYLHRLGSSTIIPGRNRAEQLENGMFRIQRLLSDTSGVTRAEIQTRASHNPAVAIDMAATLVGAGFLPGELAGGLVGGAAGRRIDIAMGGDGTRGEHLGALGGAFIAGAPRNPMRMAISVRGIHNMRKSRGLISVSGLDLAFEEAKDVLAIAKGTYKVSGKTVNAVLGIADSLVENTIGRGIENLSNTIEIAAFKGLGKRDTDRINLAAIGAANNTPEVTLQRKIQNLRDWIEGTDLDIKDAFRVNDVERGQRLEALNRTRRSVLTKVMRSENAKQMDGLGPDATPEQRATWRTTNALDPDVGGTPSTDKIYHGTRKSNLESFIDENGDLILKQSSNFGGRQVGVSFTPRLESAIEYATRSTNVDGTSNAARRQYNGSIFEIDKDAVPTRLVHETSDELFADRTSIRIPQGSFKILSPPRPDGKSSVTAFADQNKFDLAARAAATNLSNRDLAREIVLKVIRDETAEHNAGGELSGYVLEGRRLTQEQMDIADKFGPDAIDNPMGQYLDSELDRRYNQLSDTQQVAFQAEMVEAFHGMPKSVKSAHTAGILPRNIAELFRPSSYIESLNERYARKWIADIEIVSEIGTPTGDIIRIVRRNGQDVVEETGQIVGPEKVDIPTNRKERLILASYRPDISPSQLDMLNDDLTLAELSARRDGDSIYFPGKPEPRQMGQPVGKSGGDLSDTLSAHQSHLAFGDMMEIPSWETPAWTFARWWQGARNEEGLRMNTTFNSLTEYANSIDLPGRKIVDEVTGEITIKDPDDYWNFDTSMPIFRALHVGDDHKHFTDLTVDQQRLVKKIKAWRDQEENEMFDFLTKAASADAQLFEYDLKNFATTMIANPNYFPRGWRRIDQKEGQTIWDLKGAEKEKALRDFGIHVDTELAQYGTKSIDPDSTSFLKRRNNRTFDSMVDGKQEDGADIGQPIYVPKSYNPIAMMAERRMAGVEYREIIQLMTRLKKMDLLKPGGAKGYRIPGENIPLFRGRADPDDPSKMLIAAQAVPNELANWIEKTWGDPKSKITPTIKNWSNRAKTTKLLLSAFQHLDIANRATATGFSPANNIRHVVNGQFPPGLKVPALWAKMAAVQFWGPYRKKFKADLLGDANKKVHDDFDMTWGDLITQGWEVRGDLSMIQREFLDRIDNYIMPRTLKSFGEVGGTIPRAIKKLSDFWQDGLFEGVYTVSQQWALEHFIVPTIRAQHPDWSRTMVAAMAAENVNVMFSSLGSWQTALRTLPPTAQDALQVAIFSTNETEALLRGAARAALPRIVDRRREAMVPSNFGFGGSTKGPFPRSGIDTKQTFHTDATGQPSSRRKGIGIPGTNSDVVLSEHFNVFADYHVGMYLYLMTVSNLIHFSATGEALPWEAYKPISDSDPYAPFGPAYKNQFFSPQAPGLEGRGGTPIYVDVVGQMDTAFRWMTDPVNATASRMNVIPRAIMNQITATNFMAQPLEMAPIGRDPISPANPHNPTRDELYAGNFYPGGAFNPLNQGERIGQFTQDVGMPIPAISLLGGLREKFPALGHVIPPGETRLGVMGNVIQSQINLRSMGTPDLKEGAGIATFDAPAVGEIGADPDDPRISNADFHAQATTTEDDLLDDELMLRELEQVIRDDGTGGRGGKWGWVSEREAKRMWELHNDDPRIRRALINKGKWMGWDVLRWVGKTQAAEIKKIPPIILQPGERIGIHGKPVRVPAVGPR